MNKRGQIYILAALILALVLYLLITKTNIVYENELIDDFKTLSSNYDVEASKFMNRLLTTEQNIAIEFDHFTCKFTEYAENQNPDFSLIYIFEYEGNVYIGNYLNQPIIIGDTNMVVLDGCKGGLSMSTDGGGTTTTFTANACVSTGDKSRCVEVITTPTNLKLELTISSIPYDITISEDRPEIVIVSREEKGEQRKVYTKKGFVTGSTTRQRKSITDFCTENMNKPNKPTSYNTYCLSNGEVRCSSYRRNKEGCETDTNCKWENNQCINK